MFGYRTCLIVSLCFANVLCHSEERSDVRIAGNGHLVKECGYPSGRLPRRCNATSRNDIKCFARNGISDVAYSTLSVIEQSNAATNPYFVRNRAITRIPFRTAQTAHNMVTLPGDCHSTAKRCFAMT